MDKDLTQSHKKECSDWGTIWRGTVECVCEAGVWMLGSVPNKQVNTFTFSILQTLDSLQTCTWLKPAFTALHKHALESARLRQNKNLERSVLPVQFSIKFVPEKLKDEKLIASQNSWILHSITPRPRGLLTLFSYKICSPTSVHFIWWDKFVRRWKLTINNLGHFLNHQHPARTAYDFRRLLWTHSLFILYSFIMHKQSHLLSKFSQSSSDKAGWLRRVTKQR